VLTNSLSILNIGQVERHDVAIEAAQCFVKVGQIGHA